MRLARLLLLDNSPYTFPFRIFIERLVDFRHSLRPLATIYGLMPSAYGIPLPHKDWTYEEFFQWARDARRKAGDAIAASGARHSRAGQASAPSTVASRDGAG